MAEESSLESYLTTRVRQIGGLCLKFVSPGYSGVPDRIILIGGLVFFVELKALGKRLKPRQAFVHHEFRRYGHPVWTVDDAVTIDQLIKYIQQKIKANDLPPTSVSIVR